MEQTVKVNGIGNEVEVVNRVGVEKVETLPAKLYIRSQEEMANVRAAYVVSSTKNAGMVTSIAVQNLDIVSGNSRANERTVKVVIDFVVNTQVVEVKVRTVVIVVNKITNKKVVLAIAVLGRVLVIDNIY